MLPPPPINDVLIVSSDKGGHRESYVNLFAELLAQKNISVREAKLSSGLIKSRDPLFFLLIEDHFIQYIYIALARALRGRLTVGLLFRGMEVTRNLTIRHSLKGFALKTLKAIPSVRTISIIPFSANERLQKFTDNWINDPQYWDLHSSPESSAAFSEELRGLARGRKVVVALGVLNGKKGFDFFCDCLRRWGGDGSDWLFIAAGKVDLGSAGTAENFERNGGKLYNRYITEQELFTFYEIADFIWAAYSPDYNQSSGVFGRAFQYSIPVLVRKNSVSELYGREIGAEMIALDFGDVEALGEKMATFTKRSTDNKSAIAQMRERSVNVILTALGI